MSARSWNDQPLFLEGTEKLLHVFIDGTSVEVRKACDDAWYVTTGNLFGSQTIKAPSAESAMRLINLAMSTKKKDRPVKLPEGYELVPNHEKEAA